MRGEEKMSGEEWIGEQRHGEKRRGDRETIKTQFKFSKFTCGSMTVSHPEKW